MQAYGAGRYFDYFEKGTRLQKALPIYCGKCTLLSIIRIQMDNLGHKSQIIE